MRFIVDECAGPAIAAWLRERGHEIYSVYDEAKGMVDSDVLDKAFSENWILVTNDKDFGEMVYRERRPHRGVILLRLEDESMVSKINALNSLLARYSERLSGNFVVVTETRIRFGIA